MRRRISRRAFIGGVTGATALAAGGATWAAWLNRDDGGTQAAPEPSLGPSATPTPAPTLPSPPAGGRRTITAASALAVDTFDTQLTGRSAAVEILGRTHSRLVNWSIGEGSPELAGDLAERWELPDATTALFHLATAARWHNRAPLNGRQVTADDVVAHFQRALSLGSAGKAPLAQHYERYRAIQSVDAPSAGTVRFRLSSPDPYLLDTLAGEFALIQAPDAVTAFSATWDREDSEHVIGSGPWTFDWVEGGAKFSAWRSGHRQPVLDELVVTEPFDVVARFEDGRLDEAYVADRRDAAALRAASNTRTPANGSNRKPQRAVSPEVLEVRRFNREVVLSSFVAAAPPWNNPSLVATLSAALNRSELAKRLFGERAVPSPLVPPALHAPVISAERLKFIPGYGNSAPYGSPEFASALRKAWSASGGAALGLVTIDFPSVFDPLYSASSTVIDMLNGTLGPQFRPAVETYTTISRRVLEGYYGNGRAALWFGWGPPISTVMPDRYLSEVYGTVLEGQVQQVSVMESGYGGVIPWVQQYNQVFRRANMGGREPSPLWAQHEDYKRLRA